MDDAGPRSLFAVLHFARRDPLYYSILQLDLHEQNLKTTVIQKEHGIGFNQEPRFNQAPQGRPSIKWLFSPSTATEELYMVPNWGFDNLYKPTVKPFCGYKFNLRTRICQPIAPPLSSLMHGSVVNLKGHIYLLAYDLIPGGKKGFVFQCYDPEKKSWNRLEPFPYDPTVSGRIVGTAILGTAVLGDIDTVLFNVESRNIWAYDVIQKEWYPVKVEGRECYGFIGEAVVQGETIYALTNESFCGIMELSIKNRGADLVCSLCLVHYVPDFKLISEGCEFARARTTHLLHLGRNNFCFVQSCVYSYLFDYRPLQLTYIKVENGKCTIAKNHMHKLRVEGSGPFEFILGFSLPKGANTVFNLNPYHASNPVHEEELATLHTCELFRDIGSSQTIIIGEQGHSIYVTNLPPDATVKEIRKGLRKFGPIKRDGIHVGKNKKGNCFAFVEFECATSRQRAIEASTVIIGKTLTGNHSSDPEEDYASNPVHEEELATQHTSELVCRSIYVTNLPCDATFKETEKVLKEFGPIKRFEIQVGKVKKGNYFAFVEFESATSQKHAIETSPVIIGKIEAHIAGKTSTGNHFGTRAGSSSSIGTIILKSPGEGFPAWYGLTQEAWRGFSE